MTEIREVSGLVGGIGAAVAQQTAGIEQVNQAIAQMDDITQQNAALVEEAAAASENLLSQAAAMNRMMAVFTLRTSLPHGVSTIQSRCAAKVAAPLP